MTDTSAPSSPILDYAPAPKRARWLKVWAVGKWFLLAIVLFFVAKTLRHDFREVPWHELHIQWRFVGLGLLSLMLARLSNGLNCRSLLAALGEDLPARHVVPAIWVASLGRYIPGKMAAVAGALLMLVRMGARPSVAMAALFLSTALMMLMGLVISTPLLFTRDVHARLPTGPYLAAVVLVGGLICLWPRVFLAICNFAMRKLKRQPIATQMRMGQFSAAVFLTFCRNAFLGLGVWCAARALEPNLGISSYWLTLASAGLASWVGFLAVFSPAGLGVHEGIYIVTLSPLLGPKAAVVAVAMRIFQVLGDALAGGAGMIMMRTADIPDAQPSAASVGA